MAETEAKTPSEAPQEPKKPNPLVKALRENPRARAMAGWAIMVFLVLFVWWTGTLRAMGAETAGLARGADALAVSLVPGLLDRNPVKLERLLQKIAEEAGYASVTVSDPEGKVLASTDATQKDLSRPELARAPDKAEVVGGPQKGTIRRKIFLAQGNPFGILEIKLGAR
jgi:hypothetical protein